MAVTAKAYGNASLAIAEGTVDWVSDTVKVMLVDSTYTPDQSTHTKKSDVTGEITDAGYTAGGATLGSCTATASGLVTTLDAADVSDWSSNLTASRYGVIYDDTTTDKLLIGYVDFGADTIVLGITWDADGVLTFTAS